MFRVQLNLGEGQGRTKKDSKLFSFKVFISKRCIRNKTSLGCIRCLYYHVYSLRGNQDPAPSLYYCCLTAPLLPLHPLPSLTISCLNLALGTQGRYGGWWGPFPKNKKWRAQKGFCAQESHRAVLSFIKNYVPLLNNEPSKDYNFFFYRSIFFPIIAGLQCSVNFLLYSQMTQSHIHVYYCLWNG